MYDDLTVLTILLDLESSATLMDEMTLHIRQRDGGNALYCNIETETCFNVNGEKDTKKSRQQRNEGDSDADRTPADQQQQEHGKAIQTIHI